MTDLVSVIVPVYNVEEYLPRCVESLLGQTYSNIEIILVEDCSTDGSAALCEEYAATDPRVHLLKNLHNRGLEETRQRGIDHAVGEWIMLLDSDDMFSDNAVSRAVSFATENCADMVLFSYTVIHNGKTNIERASLEEGVYTKEAILKSCMQALPGNVLTCVGSKIYRRSFLLEHDVHFDKIYKYNEDAGFVLNALRHAEKIGYLDDPFYHYYIRSSGSIQTSYRPDMFAKISRADDLLKEVFVEHGVFEGQLEERWCKKHLSLYLASLENEAKYQNYKSFHKVFLQLKQDPDYNLVLNAKLSVGTMMKLMRCSLKLSAAYPLYVLLKGYDRIKRG